MYRFTPHFPLGKTYNLIDYSIPLYVLKTSKMHCPGQFTPTNVVCSSPWPFGQRDGHCGSFDGGPLASSRLCFEGARGCCCPRRRGPKNGNHLCFKCSFLGRGNKHTLHSLHVGRGNKHIYFTHCGFGNLFPRFCMQATSQDASSRSSSMVT